jgi:hypothetical protein
MKIHKLLSVVALLISSVGLASAQQGSYLANTNYLYITGSTANRAPADAAIIAQFDTTPTPVVYNADSAIGGEHSSIFYGTISGQAWVVKTCWTGSEAGIQTVSGVLSVAYLNDSYIPASDSATAPNVTGETSQQTNDDYHVSDAAFADTYQAASEFTGTFHGVNYPALTEYSGGSVAVNVFKFWTNNGAPSSLTGVTSQTIKKLFIAGKLPLSMLTGNNADEGSTVYAVGRNPDSGTRVTTMLETGAGTSVTVCKQYAPENGGSVLNASGAVQTLALYPSGTVDGISIATGNNGYSSGGNLAKALTGDFTNGGAGVVVGNTYNATGSSHKLAVVGYASSNDGDGQIVNGLKELSYNGVLLGQSSNYNNVTALTEGQYTFWSYEHLYLSAVDSVSGSPTAQTTLINAIGAGIPTAAALPGNAPAVALSSMKVTRASDGAVVATGITVY